MLRRTLLLCSTLLGCGAGDHPTVEGFVLRNDRPTKVYVQASCGVPGLELRRNGEAVRYQRSYCGVCACDAACDCPACAACSQEPLTLEPGAKLRVVWSGEVFHPDTAPRCGARCMKGESAPEGSWRLRLCYSPYPFDATEAVDGSRNLACIDRAFDPFTGTEVDVDLAEGAKECASDADCGDGEMCNLSTSRAFSDGSIASGQDGEGLCRRKCDAGCLPDSECRPVKLLRDEERQTVSLCFPK